MKKTHHFDKVGCEGLEDTRIGMGSEEDTVLFGQMPTVVHKASAADKAREVFCLKPVFVEDVASELLINPKGEVKVSLDPGVDLDQFLAAASHRVAQLMGMNPLAPQLSFLVLDQGAVEQTSIATKVVRKVA